MSKKQTISVDDFLIETAHPQLRLINDIRLLIKNTSSQLSERIKWNAPSYHLNETDIVTFGPLNRKNIMLVFHHPSIILFDSSYLEGNYKDRRLMYFKEDSLNKEQSHILKEIILFSLKEIQRGT